MCFTTQLALLSMALICAAAMTIIIRLPKKNKIVNLNGRIVSINPRRVIKTPSITKRVYPKQRARPLNLGLKISQASSSALSEPESIGSSATIEEQQNSEQSIATANSMSVDSKDCDSVKTMIETESPAPKKVLVQESLPKQPDESLIISSPKKDVFARFDESQLPKGPKGGRTGRGKITDGKVPPCSANPKDRETQITPAESSARSVDTDDPEDRETQTTPAESSARSVDNDKVDTDKTLGAYQRKDRNTLAENKKLEFFTVEGLRSFVEKNSKVPAASFMTADQQPSMLRTSQCVSYLMGVFPFVLQHEILLKQLQNVAEHAQKMSTNLPASSPGSAASLKTLRLKLALFVELGVSPILRQYKEYDELNLRDMEVSGTSAKWKRLRSGHKIRKLVRYIRTQADSVQARRSRLLEEFANLMLTYHKHVRESKGLHVDEDACSRVRSVFNKESRIK